MGEAARSSRRKISSRSVGSEEGSVQVLTVEPPGMVYLGGVESRERGEWEGDVCPGRRSLALEEGESGQRQIRQLRVVF
jgi:hypothetical protein